MNRRWAEIAAVAGAAALLEFGGPDRIRGWLAGIPVMGIAIFVVGRVLRFLAAWVDL